ncbi:MAG: hypothetical protein HRT58_00805 [Crocinitomicaceae bacterium]|nr:hypothetical protein [Flavobacteriales bacterium]NQZ34162.1 hypothetical protein [Crocinitomicaceae bacterium]
MYKIYRLTGLAVLSLAAISLLNSCEETTKGNSEEDVEMFIYELELEKVTTNSFTQKVNLLVQNNAFSREFIQMDGKRSIGYFDEKNDIYFNQDIATSNFSFNKGIQKYLGDYAPSLPAQRDAEGIAMDFLQKNKFLQADNNEIKLLHSGGLRADAGPNGAVIDKMRTVTFGRTIDNIAVMGSGSKIVVNIGDKNEITGLVYKWRNVNVKSKKAVTKEEMVSRESAEKAFNALITEQFGREAKVNIEEFNLIYYDGDGRYIQPVYGIRATVSIQLSKGKTNEIPYMTYVNALKKPAEKLKIFDGTIEGKKLVNREKEGNGSSNSEGKD